jgi:hypothetical protein
MKRINDPRGTSRRINKLSFQDDPFVFYSKKPKKKMTKKEAKEFADKVTEEIVKVQPMPEESFAKLYKLLEENKDAKIIIK